MSKTADRLTLEKNTGVSRPWRKETNKCLSDFYFFSPALIQPFVILQSLETNIQPPPFRDSSSRAIAINTPTHTGNRRRTTGMSQTAVGRVWRGYRPPPKLMRNNRIVQSRAAASYYRCQEQTRSRQTRPTTQCSHFVSRSLY